MGDGFKDYHNAMEIADLKRELADARAALEFLQTRYDANTPYIAGLETRVKVAEHQRDRLREAILWACGVRGEFPVRREEQGIYYWRRGLRQRAGITSEELNAEALAGGEGE